MKEKCSGRSEAEEPAFQGSASASFSANFILCGERLRRPYNPA
ncbi:hypothetical protein [Treponema sp. Marseille-Q4132]|nr:hypothetical protein [Treponema sp. Marseille-Q4132]